MQKIFGVFILSALLSQAKAQELECKTTVVYKQIQTTNTQIFKTLETAINEFMNNRQWTNQKFKANEKIQCNVLINLSEYSNNEAFKGTISIQARRPVYNSNFNTPLLNIVDNNFTFNYKEFDPLDFNENSISSNLTAVLGYYAYILLGTDFDTFSRFGGTPWFQLAERIVSNAQSLNDIGWKASENKNNRYWIANQLLNNEFRPYREFVYIYHRKGLDQMADDAQQGAGAIVDALPMLETVNNAQPSSVALKLFFDAKSQELVSMLKELPSDKRITAATILKKTDPGRTQEYQKLN